MTCHYPDLGRAYHWLKQISFSTRPIRSSTKIWVVTSHRHGNSAVLRRYFAGKPVVESKIAFSVLLKLTEKNKMRHLLFLSGTVYAVYNYRYFKPWISQKSYVSSALLWKILSRVFENVVIEQSFMEPPLHVLFATTTTVTTILFFFSCIYLIFIYLLDEVLVNKETQIIQSLAIKSSHLEVALGQ